MKNKFHSNKSYNPYNLVPAAWILADRFGKLPACRQAGISADFERPFTLLKRCLPPFVIASAAKSKMPRGVQSHRDLWSQEVGIATAPAWPDPRNDKMIRENDEVVLSEAKDLVSLCKHQGILTASLTLGLRMTFLEGGDFL